MLLAATAAGLLLGESGAVASGSTPGAGLSKPAVPIAGRAYVGAFVPGGPHDPPALQRFAQAAGRNPDVVVWFQGWGSSTAEFDPTAAAAVRARRALPMITWEPWDWRAGRSQPEYSLEAISSGRHDAYIRRYAAAARAYGGPLLLRFAHEMNADHYPWSEQANGNGSGSYVRAWRHVHDVFTAAGADNVAWVWSPSISHAGTAPLRPLYPGPAYVDWVAADGYNGGSELPWGGWLGFRELFGPTLAELAQLAPDKPQMIGETASVEGGGDKAAWISDMFRTLRTLPQVRAVVWFDENKEADWRISSSSAAQRAFSDAVRRPTLRLPGHRRRLIAPRWNG